MVHRLVYMTRYIYSTKTKPRSGERRFFLWGYRLGYCRQFENLCLRDAIEERERAFGIFLFLLEPQ